MVSVHILDLLLGGYLSGLGIWGVCRYFEEWGFLAFHSSETLDTVQILPLVLASIQRDAAESVKIVGSTFSAHFKCIYPLILD